MKKNSVFAVIMAGGGGTRFWPWSREKQPKQILPLLSNRSMIWDTVERVRPLIPRERIFIVTAQSQVAELQKEIEAVKQELLPQLLALLGEKGIQLLSHGELAAKERKELREYYFRNIYPLITPQSIDPAHPFPFISNLSLNLLVTLRYPKDKDLSLSRVKVPVGAGIPRFLRVGASDRFVLLEEVIE